MASFFNSLDISASALTAQRLRMDVISTNIANVSTTRTADGTPYKRKTVIFEEINSKNFSDYFSAATNKLTNSGGGGVKVTQIAEDTSAGVKEYAPEHPDADANGYVEKSNVNIVTEMVNMISANRSYEASITAFNTTKSMISKTMEITK